jgi:hypothetical protein
MVPLELDRWPCVHLESFCETPTRGLREVVDELNNPPPPQIRNLPELSPQ